MAKNGFPLPVVRALKKLGRDIRNSRLRRRIQHKILAERASVSKPTLIRIERGAATVSMGAYASVLFSLGMNERLAALADFDSVGQMLQDEQLPKRIRIKNVHPIENMYPFSGA